MARKIGALRFYGPPEFIEECVKSINEELAKYDDGLQTLFVSGGINLIFSQDDNRNLSFPTAGFYVIPKKIWNHGPEGICQYVVYAHIRSKCTGRGILAALRLASNRENYAIVPKQKMVTWLRATKYPSDWVECYQ
jgi:hypothetical protein